MYKADKIILHGLFDIYLVVILFFNPWLLKKCYWVIWGGDLYYYKLAKNNLKKTIKEIFRKFVIKRTGFLITYIPGDVELARKWYGAKGKYCECIMYLSNVFHNVYQEQKKDCCIHIQIGNSADPSNNHAEIINLLEEIKEENIKIYAPLSYGDKEYANKIINEGKEKFGDKFIPLVDFIEFEDYLAYMNKIDIAIFNHNRQQAMGNIINFIGKGKKVYIKKGTSHCKFLKECGLKTFDFEKNSFNLSLLSKRDIENNKTRIKTYFSESNLKDQLYKIVS